MSTQLYSAKTLFDLGPQRVYPADAKEAAFLLGGIGTGNVSIGSRGELRDWEIWNWPGKKQFLPFSFFAIWAKSAHDNPVAKILEAKIPLPYSKSHGFLNGELAGLPRLASSRMRGEYPFVWVDFDDDDLPVSVQLEAFTPLLPLNADDSGIPCAVIRYRVKNPTSEPVDVSVVGTLANAVGFDGYDVFNNLKLAGEVHNEFREEDTHRGLYYTSANLPPGHFKYGSMALLTTNQANIIRPAWLHGQWTDNAQDFWDDFSEDGLLKAVEDVEATGSELLKFYDFSFLNLREKIGSLGSQQTVLPGAEQVFEFILAWHFPNRPKGWVEYDADLKRYQEGGYDVIRNYYATLFENAWDVGDYTVQELSRLEKVTRDFHNALFSSTLPPYVIDAVASNITSMRSPVCFRIEDGSFLGWEGIRDYVGCGQGNVNHVWNYAQSVAFLFPELEQIMRRVEFLTETDDEGAMTFRARRVLGEDKWQMVPAADGQLGSVVRLYREWKLSGDNELVQDLWDRASRALDYAFREWDKDNDFVLDGQQSNTYDIEFYGPNPMMNSIFFAALKAGAEMARLVGDAQRASNYQQAFDLGSKRMDDLLWNGEYYIQKLDDINQYRYQHGIGCHSDQLLGQFLAHVSGLGYILPEDHVRGAVQSIYHYNFRNQIEDVQSVQRTYALYGESALVLCSWPHGGRPRFPFAYCDEVWTGVEYQVAASLIYEGHVEEGLTIVKSVRDRYDGYRRSPWSEIEAGHHYVRAMASWALLPALSGFQCDVVNRRMSFAPAIHAQHFRTFWINGNAWGTYEQRQNPGTGETTWDIHVLYGSLNDFSINS